MEDLDFIYGRFHRETDAVLSHAVEPRQIKLLAADVRRVYVAFNRALSGVVIGGTVM